MNNVIPFTGIKSHIDVDKVQEYKALKKEIKSLEMEYIVNALEQSKGNILEASELLGISQKLLGEKITKFLTDARDDY